jgi:lysozyme
MQLRSLSLFVLPFLLGCGYAEEPVGHAEEAVKVCAGPTTLAGIDASHWQGSIDWAQVKGSGRTFAVVKATEGTTYVDTEFAANWAGMKQQGVVRSAYHFFHANLDPIAQADHFLQVIGPLEVGDLPPMLDVELADGQTGATITSTAIQWLDYVAMKTGIKPIFHSYPSFVTGTMGSPAGLEKHGLLWIANWGVQCPEVPAPFTAWQFWQTSDMGAVPGISGVVDLDVFNGTLADLDAITVQSPASSSSSSGGVGGAGGAGGAPSSSDGPGAASSSDVGSGTGGSSGDNGLEPGDPGCTCGVNGSDGRTAWYGAAGLFALAFALRFRARSRHREMR